MSYNICDICPVVTHYNVLDFGHRYRSVFPPQALADRRGSRAIPRWCGASWYTYGVHIDVLPCTVPLRMRPLATRESYLTEKVSDLHVLIQHRSLSEGPPYANFHRAPTPFLEVPVILVLRF